MVFPLKIFQLKFVRLSDMHHASRKPVHFVLLNFIFLITFEVSHYAIFPPPYSCPPTYILTALCLVNYDMFYTFLSVKPLYSTQHLVHKYN